VVLVKILCIHAVLVYYKCRSAVVIWASHHLPVDTVQARHVSLFGHAAWVDGNANAKQTLIAAVPEDWKTTPGCPAITWMRTDEFKSHNLILTGRQHLVVLRLLGWRQMNSSLTISYWLKSLTWAEMMTYNNWVQLVLSVVGRRRPCQTTAFCRHSNTRQSDTQQFWRQNLCRRRPTSLEQSAVQSQTMWTVVRPVQAVTEDTFIRTVRPRCSVNCF